jgi:site-specific DNA-methyltransferase (adenine-specific)
VTTVLTEGVKQEGPERTDMDFEVGRVYLGDSREVLRRFPDSCVDLIVTSPPYADNRKTSYGGIPPSEYVEWFRPISEQLKRVLKPDGSFVLNIKERVVNGERGTYVYDLVKDMRGQGWLWIEEYIWHKKNTYPGYWRNRFRDLWEHCYHFTKSKKFRMYQDEVKVEVGDWAETRLNHLGKNDTTRYVSKTKSGFGKNVSNWVGKERVLPGNVLHMATESSNTNHSAAFPVSLPSWFIRLLTKEGDVVLDPFLGSGTSAIAALRLKREYVGIEKIEEYYKTALDRIALEKQANSLQRLNNGT